MIPSVKEYWDMNFKVSLRVLNLGDRYVRKPKIKIEWERIGSKLIHIIAFNVVNLDTHEDINILPLNQVKKLRHMYQWLVHF